MKKKKKQPLTSKQIYKRNKKIARRLSRFAPVVFWVFFAVGIVLLLYTFNNSVGNVLDIMAKLDSGQYNKTEIATNYKELIEKWGEWQIIGGEGGGVGVTFINIPRAFFSGLFYIYGILTLISLFIAVFVGKFLLPRIVKKLDEKRAEDKDLDDLEANEKLKKIAERLPQIY
jgi:hypothetical protein